LTLPEDIAQVNGTLEGAIERIPQEVPAPRIFLRRLEIENFRAIRHSTFTFQPGLNVVIGANNAAKSAVVDALRLIFNIGTFEKKEDLIRLRTTDVYGTSDESTPPSLAITLSATFLGPSDSDLSAQFYELLCPDERERLDETTEQLEYAVFRLRYQVTFEYSLRKARYENRRSELKGGPNLNNPLPYETLDTLRAVYLAPLRDLVNDRVRVGTEIERLILSHTLSGNEEARKAIPDILQQKVIELIRNVTDDKHHAAAGKNLSEYAKPYQIPEGALSFAPWGISDGLFSAMQPVFEHSLHGMGKLPLSSNGLGINQLIYASIVLSRRSQADADTHTHTFFLIEEPEAHLHPQLQDSFFYALNQIQDHQIFVTSHSPTITAKTDLNRIIVMRRPEADNVARPLHLSQVYAGRDHDRRYLHKFLDVTRSQLLFARGAVFVEGITEALLIQRFSEIIGKSLRDMAIEIIVIDSAYGFDHFRPLFDGGEDAYCRGVFITDGDEDPKEVATDDVIRDANRTLGHSLEETGNTATVVGYGTFEFELLRASILGDGNAGMQEIMERAMRRAAPAAVQNSQNEFVRDFLDFENPSLAYKKMKENRSNSVLGDDDWYATWRTNSYFKAAKSDFAFYLAEELAKLPVDDAREKFMVPSYIRYAIEYVTTGQPTDDKDEAIAADG
jgi:putative ATP-dependent endonuclease of OLD family